MHKTWSSIEEMPFCFSRSSVRFQGHTTKKSSILSLIGRFQTVIPLRIHWWLCNDTQSLMQHRRGDILFFKVGHPSNFKVTWDKNRRFWPELRVSGLYLKFGFTDTFELMHKAWCSIEEVPYYSSRSSIKFQGHTGWKIYDLNPIWVRFFSRPVAALKSLRFALSFPNEMSLHLVYRYTCSTR